MTLRAISLEAFDPPLDTPPGPSADYLAGYDAAMAEVEHSQSAAQLRALDVAANALADFSFTHAEARRTVLAALSPLFTAIATRLLPGLRGESLRLYLIDALETAAKGALSKSISVQLAPADHAALTALSPGLPAHCSLSAAADLPAGTILIASDRDEHCLDIEALLVELHNLMTMTANLASDEAHPRGNHVRHSA